MTHSHGRGTFPQQYALFTGLNIPLSGCVDETVEMIYDQGVLDLCKEGSYTGMW